ncbi:MAG: AAA family ATPase, partial [Victivallaceae bacterium]
LYKVNPGLKRRFPHEVIFDDFTPEELKGIFYRNLAQDRQKIRLAEQDLFDAKLLGMLARMRNERHFGNAGAINNFYRDVVKNNQLNRLLSEPEADHFELTVADLTGQKSSAVESIEDILSELEQKFIGMTDLKKQLRNLTNKIRFDRLRAEKLKQVNDRITPGAYNMRFVGNPGTGKTTIARYMARVFTALGIIDHPNVKEYRGVDLKGSFVGQTKDKVNEIFENSSGYVVVIDEIYSLCNS